MGKKLKRGPFNAYVDPDQVGEGSAMLELTEAAKKAGTYDVWAEEVPEKVAPVSLPSCIFVFLSGPISSLGFFCLHVHRSRQKNVGEQ